MTDFSDLNDSLDDLIGGPIRIEPKAPPASYAETRQTYFEPCGKCRGTGQTPWGVCFRCKGQRGKSFKTSAQERAKNRIKAAERRVLTGVENYAAFKQLHPDIAAWIEVNTVETNSKWPRQQPLGTVLLPLERQQLRATRPWPRRTTR